MSKVFAKLRLRGFIQSRLWSVPADANDDGLVVPTDMETLPSSLAEEDLVWYFVLKLNNGAHSFRHTAQIYPAPPSWDGANSNH